MCRLYQFDQYEINLLLCDFQARTEGGGGVRRMRSHHPTDRKVHIIG